MITLVILIIILGIMPSATIKLSEAMTLSLERTKYIAEVLR